MRRFCFLATVAALGTLWAADDEKELVEQETCNAWHFRVGPVMAPRVRVSVSGPRRVVPMSPAATLRRNRSGDAVADPSAGYVGRRYADGYVNPDEGTSDPDSMISGLTWNWGANDVPSQYSDGRMEFRTDRVRSSESVSSSSFSSGSSSEHDRDVLLGVEAMGGWTFFDNKTFDAAVDAGFRYYGSGDLSAKSRYGTSVTTTREDYRYVDSYDASGWSAVPSGSHVGTPGGPGRLLGATPSRREELMGAYRSAEKTSYQGTTKLDYNIWDLRLGPTVGWKPTDSFALRGGVYGLLGLVDAELEADTRSSSGSYRARSSTCGAVFGMAFGLSAQLNLTKNIFITGGVEYDWWTDAVSLDAGDADARIKLSDMSVSLALGVEF